VTAADAFANVLNVESISFANQAPVSITTVDPLVASGKTLNVDASALTGTNTLTWNGAAEVDGAFFIVAGSSASTLTGGACADTFDFTGSGVVFSKADTVNGGAGIDTLKIGTVTAATALNNVTNVESISFANQAPVSITTLDSLVASGKTLSVDASALTGSNTFTWDASAENGGSFSIKAGTSTATIYCGYGSDTFDFTASGRVFSSADTVSGGQGGDTLKIGNVTTTNALDNVYGIGTISFENQAPVSITTVDSLVSSNGTLTVDATALTGSNTFTWNGASESDGKYSIKTGSSNATITGGSGADTIVVGSGTNWICGGPGSDTITLGSGADTLVFNSLMGTDSISGFNWVQDTLTFSVSTASFVTLAGTTVNASSIAYFSMGNNKLTGNTSTPVVLSVITAPITSSSALLTRLASGGTNAVTLSSACSKNSLILVLYSDGTDAHMVAVCLGTAAKTFSTSELTVYEIATLKGITSLAGWSAVRFELTN
jgi:trimeric autotransporter adhesin